MFLNGDHKKRYREIKKDSREYEALIYILTGNEDLYNEINKIYDIKNRRLELNFDSEGEPILSDLWLSSSSAALLRLAIQLFNGAGKQNVFETFCSLDSENTKLAMEAIRIRFEL